MYIFSKLFKYLFFRILFKIIYENVYKGIIPFMDFIENSRRPQILHDILTSFQWDFDENSIRFRPFQIIYNKSLHMSLPVSRWDGNYREVISSTKLWMELHLQQINHWAVQKNSGKTRVFLTILTHKLVSKPQPQSIKRARDTMTTLIQNVPTQLNSQPEPDIKEPEFSPEDQEVKKRCGRICNNLGS